MGASLDSAVKIKADRQQKNQRAPKPKPVRIERTPAKPPTPERANKARLYVEPVFDEKGMEIKEGHFEGGPAKEFAHNYETASKAEVYRINSWHTMMHNRGKLSDDQFKTCAKYVAQWDITNRSPLKSNLDRSISSGEGGPSFSYLDAIKNIAHWNARIGRTEAKELVLVCCEGLGYHGAATALFGETAKRADEDRIKKRFIKTIDDLFNYMG